MSQVASAQVAGAALLPIAFGALMSCTALANEPEGAGVAAPAPSQVRPEDGLDLTAQVRAMQSVPVRADAVMSHEPLGPCHNCHVILPAAGQVALTRRIQSPPAPSPVPPAPGRGRSTRCVEPPAPNRGVQAPVAPPVAQAAPPVAQVAPRVVQAAPPVAQAAPPVVQAAPPVAQAAPRVAQVVPPVVQAAPRVVQAAPPARQAAPPAPTPSLPLAEAHWQGLELIPLTPTLTTMLLLPLDARGVVVDQATPPADHQGFAGGDLVTAIGGHLTPDLESFIIAADLFRDQAGVDLQIIRATGPVTVTLQAPRLGVANGEFAPTIAPDAPIPHGNAPAHARTLNLVELGPCKSCHPIRKGGGLPLDLNLVLANPPKPAPPTGGATRPPSSAGGPP